MDENKFLSARKQNSVFGAFSWLVQAVSKKIFFFWKGKEINANGMLHF
jgi:hypothetical protein